MTGSPSTFADSQATRPALAGAAGSRFRPVLQTRNGVPAGNCFSACVASILGLTIDDVPDYQCDYSDDQWWDKWEAWFAARGLIPDLTWDAPAGYAMMSVRTPTPHCVVVLDGVMVWNPLGGLPLPTGTEIRHYMTILPLSANKPDEERPAGRNS